MKTKILKTSFRLFSFLAEKTKGWRVFVQPKLWLGILILSSTSACKTVVVTDTPPEDILIGTCYAIAKKVRIPTDTIAEDTPLPLQQLED